jgi:hypothetical protein
VVVDGVVHAGVHLGFAGGPHPTRAW